LAKFLGCVLASFKRGGLNLNITVYLASSTGNDPKFMAAVRELGTWIGASKNVNYIVS
jgi:hypothetical protein